MPFDKPENRLRFSLTQFFKLFPLLALLTACATPSEHFEEVAGGFGFVGFSLNSGQFDHRFYANSETIAQSDQRVLHVYLDGDGTPWERRRWIAGDPTSRKPMILELMSEDKTASIFLGRPCYHGFSMSPDCDNKYWTSHRYSEAVVSSMATVLKLWLQQHSFKHVVLIGYSGGGALAMLISPYLDSVDIIVTVASNVDVKAWCRFHGYSPLKYSLDPGLMAFSARIRQIHLAGLKDEIVPAKIIESFSNKQKNAEYITFADFDHHCCWAKKWKKILTLF